jgi:hypothetical protein
VPGGAALRRSRAAAQLLGERAARTPEDVVEHLLAVQAQDLRWARIALGARGVPHAEDVDAALRNGRLVGGWLLRGTLHLVRARDYGWLHALCAPRQRSGSVRRLGQLGVAEDQVARAVALIAEAVADGPKTRVELAEACAAEGIPTEGQATPHLIGRAAIEGALVLVGDHLYAAPPELVEPDHEPLSELGWRYLRAHAPAEPADLAAWSGLPLGQARTALARAGAVEVAEAPDRIPAAHLPQFDEYLLGWKDRSFAVPADLAKTVHPGGGILRAVTTADGRVTGTWSLRDPPADVARFLARD